jgi:CheY-like chemotaxis protein
MDGLSLVKQLKGREETRRIPIVVVTAFPNLFNKAELLGAGCDAYLSKPIDTRTLSQSVAEAAGRKSQGE